MASALAEENMAAKKKRNGEEKRLNVKTAEKSYQL